MVTQLPTQTVPSTQLRDILQSARCRWLGCQWRTAFGPRRLNLMNVRSQHARIIAEATPGEESTAWYEAYQYLLSVENDARLATTAACEAVELANAERYGEALAQIERAVSLERLHREPTTWVSLRDEIAALSEAS